MRLAPTLTACCLALVFPAAAFAGMPSIELTDVTKLRVENISFFLVVFLLASWGVQLLWNGLRKDFTFLPRLTFLRALGLVTLWGFLFVLVLTMISGARELMTPGAWEKVGLTYKLKKDAHEPPPAAEQTADQLERERRRKLDTLRVALWEYAKTHDGRFPPDRETPGVPAEFWRTPDPSGIRYAYPTIRKLGDDKPLVLEPDVFGDDRFVLFADGEIRRLSRKELNKLLDGEVRR